MRGVAIALVILDHMVGTAKVRWCERLLDFLGAGIFNVGCGVQIFFVLSGYLITSILIREYDTIGRIDFKAFYCRRILRIFPAFYLYWAFIVALTASGVLIISPTELAFAAAHLLNYSHAILLLLHQPTPVSHNYWFIGHFWTLSMEEQFYWLWPIVLLLLLRSRWYGILAAYLFLLPVLRLATYALFPGVRGQIMLMLHTGSDAIVCGCLLALMTARFPQMAQRLCFPAWGVAALIFYILVVDTGLEQVMPRGFNLALGATLLALAITLVVANVVLQKDAWYHRVLEWRGLVNLGRISYSVYLWQQVFFSFRNPTLLGKFPCNLIAAVMAGWISYRFVELPFIRLKDKYFPPHTKSVADHGPA